MSVSVNGLLAAAREAAYTMPIEDIDVTDPALFHSDTMWPYFERLRHEDPLHRGISKLPDVSEYWSVTKYNDIVQIDTNHQVFSSEPDIFLADLKNGLSGSAFINSDPPVHTAHRKTVQPMVSSVNLARLEPLIRERAAKILDDVPIGEAFNWVDKVSIELTTMTLATLFDFPWEDRRKLTRWSDVAFGLPGSKTFTSTDPAVVEQERQVELMECLQYFSILREERRNAEPRPDLISMLAHGEATRDMDNLEFLSMLIVLIVGGNDTTRNTITGSLVALDQFPDQERILRGSPDLIPAMVSETIRWQTPIAHFRRTAKADYDLRGKTIRAGEKVVMWYVSGNRDDEIIERADAFWIERPRVRQHLSFGSGIHRCVGNRLAELQLKIIWEEILKRFPRIEIVAAPERVFSSFVRGYEELMVVIPDRR